MAMVGSSDDGDTTKDNRPKAHPLLAVKGNHAGSHFRTARGLEALTFHSTDGKIKVLRDIFSCWLASGRGL